MKKKTVRKKRTPSKKSTSYLQYVVITFAIVALVIVGKAGYQTLNSYGVLGSSSDSFEQQDSLGTPEPKETPNPKESPEPTQAAEANQPKSFNPRNAPDSLNAEINNEIQKTNQERVTQQTELQAEGNKIETNTVRNGVQIQLKTEDNGSVSIHAQGPNGEVQMQSEPQTLEKINDSLKENDIEIGTNSANQFEITNKETKAQTDFPLNVDTETHTLSVDTPAGQKNLTVLPDQAVQNLLNQKVIDRVTQTTPSTSGAQMALVQLKLYGNNPVFQVNGVDDRKLLGFIPIQVQKTALVSAQTGQVVSITQSFLNQVFNLLSVQQ